MSRPCWHILLIDDSADDRADLRQMLLCGASRRYRFSEAPLGAAGVRQVLEALDGTVDCVLLDYVLPDMDAPEVLAALCQGADTPPCPVVVITGRDREDGLKLLGCGAQEYIGKRWTSPESLTRAVENAVERFAMMAARQHAEAALRSSEERFRSLFNSIDSGYAIHEMIFDASGVAVDARYLLVNPAFAQQSGIVDAEGRMVRELLPDLETTWLETYGSVALTGEPVRMVRHSESMQRWFDIYAFRLGAPHLRQVAVLFKDITERKQGELSLLAAKDEAEKASRAKSEFLMSMSHELRSPLSAMLGYTQLIDAGTPAPTPAQAESVHHILRAGWYLLGLINEILDLTAIESNRLVLASEAVSLQEVFEDCRAMSEPQAQQAGIELHFEGHRHHEEACLVQGDSVRAKQVLLNLLSNAIKYNRSAGRVDVRCRAVPGQRVRVSVADTGAGMSEAQMAQLFQPFNRLGQESGTQTGTGIGLVICRRLVELMGGRIGVDSTPGKGSCFWFELAAAPAPASAPAMSAPLPHLPVRTVLCIESDASRVACIEELVARRPDVCLLRAREVAGGVEIARAARPDAILMGILPLDAMGVQALQQLSLDPATAHIPVILMGAEALPEAPWSDLPAGYFRSLVHPVQSEALERALEMAFQRTHAGSQRAPAKENP